MEPLIRLLHGVRPMSPALEAHLRSKIQFYRFKKGQKIVTQGEMAPLILFVEKGLIRSYRLSGDKEVINYFMREGDIIISVIAFFMQVPAIESIDALEEVSGWGISWQELEEAYELFMEFNIHGRKICTNYYVRSELRWDSQQGKTPEEKYAALMKEDAEIVRRVKVRHMESYLDVSKATYYRIRRDYAKKKRRGKP